jgi:hypothetical protein
MLRGKRDVMHPSAEGDAPLASSGRRLRRVARTLPPLAPQRVRPLRGHSRGRWRPEARNDGAVPSGWPGAFAAGAHRSRRGVRAIVLATYFRPRRPVAHVETGAATSRVHRLPHIVPARAQPPACGGHQLRHEDGAWRGDIFQRSAACPKTTTTHGTAWHSSRRLTPAACNTRPTTFRSPPWPQGALSGGENNRYHAMTGTRSPATDA